jgi:flagellin-like protein
LHHGKKAVSPLIATVLLLAFAVALATVILQINPFSKDCDDANVRIAEVDGVKKVCYHDDEKKISFDLVNSEFPIHSIKVSVSGSSKVLNIDNVGVRVPTNTIYKISFPYDSNVYGTPNNIIITSRVNISNSLFECPITDVTAVVLC